jgi:GNAT superfamily N-acetyltransferase
MPEPVRPVIRAATVADAEAIGRVHVASWQTTYGGKLPQAYIDQLTVERRTAYWTAVLQRETSTGGTFVACDSDGQVVGFASCGAIRRALPPYDSEIYVIYLLESAQGHGLGRGLMSACLHYLAGLGFGAMMLWVLSDNPKARAFYAAMGGIDLDYERSEEVLGQTVYERAYGWPHIREAIAALEG